jgi:hypothetical protein
VEATVAKSAGTGTCVTKRIGFGIAAGAVVARIGWLKKTNRARQQETVVTADDLSGYLQTVSNIASIGAKVLADILRFSTCLCGHSTDTTCLFGTDTSCLCGMAQTLLSLQSSPPTRRELIRPASCMRPGRSIASRSANAPAPSTNVPYAAAGFDRQKGPYDAWQPRIRRLC